MTFRRLWRHDRAGIWDETPRLGPRSARRRFTTEVSSQTSRSPSSCESCVACSCSTIASERYLSRRTSSVCWGAFARELGQRRRLAVVVGVISPAWVRGAGLGRRMEKLAP
jgi:hypothetical protein